MKEYVKDAKEPFIFKKKEVNLEIQRDVLTPDLFYASYNEIFSHTLMINGNPILSVWTISTLLKTKRLIFNDSFDRDDLLPLLKAYKKYVKAARKEYYKRICESSTKKSML